MLAGLSGAVPDELSQEIVVSGLAGEVCRFNRPARALTVRGDSRCQDDLPWIILLIEERGHIPWEEIRLVHLGKELTAPQCMRGNTDLRNAGRTVELTLIRRPIEIVEFHNYYWRLQDFDRRYIIEEEFEVILSKEEHGILSQETCGPDPWEDLTKVDPDLYQWSGNSRSRFHTEEAFGNCFVQGKGGLSRPELVK